jgi:hypothetical protein
VRRTLRTPRRGAIAFPTGGVLALLTALLLSSCGSSTDDGVATLPRPRPVNETAGGCAATVARALGEVGSRIYAEAAKGGNVEEAVGRVKSSAALKTAIAANDASAAAAALNALLVNQIVRIEIIRNGRKFAAAGSAAAIAPVHGRIPGTDASYVLSTQAARSYLQVTQQVTGAQIVLYRSSGRLAGTISGPSVASVRHDGRLQYRGHSYQVSSVTGATYPTGGLQIALLVPSSTISCPGSLEQARVETLGHVGERIYQEERHSSYVLATVRQIEDSASFQRAVAARDAAATRAGIIGFFAAHIHVVRVRVTVPASGGGERLLYDLGGPYVLAPVHGTLRSGGQVIAHFAMAIQDDAGYLKLAHLFTGAQVLMRSGSRQVMGTLDPGPATVPDRGELGYRGLNYQVYSFTGEAFPSGPLRISLLLPSGKPNGG